MTGGITLSKKEIERIPIFEKLLRKEISNDQAAKMNKLSIRQCKRIKKEYKRLGVVALSHKNRGKESNNCISKDTIELAINIIKEKYHDFGPTFALEKLQKKHGITFSVETLRKAMIAEGIWKTKTRHKAHVHQPRLRRSTEGELIQLDGSEHKWFENRGNVCTLIAYVDDATSKLIYAEFLKSESTWSYFNSFKKLVVSKGKPIAMYSDKHGVFRVNSSKNGSSASSDSHALTQFGRAMKELNITMIHANSPQAKGRIERSFGTLQDRLVKEMRLLKISSIEKANSYLPKFIKEYNKKFAVLPANKTLAYRKLLSNENIDEILTIQEKRILSKNLTCQYKNKLYLINTNQSKYLLRKASVIVSETEDNKVKLTYKGKNLKYSIINKFDNTQPISRKEVNNRVDEALHEIKNTYCPPTTHPYKKRSYELMLKRKQLTNV
jgi:transposase